jgi:predicted CoA-binding protein
MKVLVFGYSDNPERFSYKAFHLLQDSGHQAIKFNPRTDQLNDVDQDIDTITLYVSKAMSDKFIDFFMSLKFRRMIFNPGTENITLEEQLKNKGIEVEHACTLVLIKTGQF